MSDLINPSELVPILVVLAEILVMFYLSRRGMKWRFAWIAGSYFFFVVLCLVYGFVVPDEFGFSFIPVLIIANPWLYILGKLNPVGDYTAWFLNPGGMLVSIILNCAIFYAVGERSYHERPDDLSDQQAT